MDRPATRVLIFHAGLAPYRIDLFNELHKRLDIRLVFLDHRMPYHHELDQEALCSRLRCEYDYLAKGIRIAGRDFQMGIRRAIAGFKPDAVVTSEFSYATLATLFCRDFPIRKRFGHIVWTADNLVMLHEMRRLRSALRSVCSRLSDGILVYSQPVKDAFLQRFGVPEQKVFLCANHQNEEAFAERWRSARKLTATYVRRYSLHGKCILLFVGRLVKVKNLERALEAFAVVAQTLANVMMVFVGDGPELATLQDKVSRLGLINQTLFVGHREGDDLLVWYLLAWGSLLASTSETYGAVVNESLLAGVPVLCSRRAGARVLIQEGKNGHVFDPYNVENLASVMRLVLSQGTPADIVGQIQRNSLMPVPFERDVNSFVKAVNYVASITN